MSESIILDTPEQISMWVLLSRRHQIKMHLAGYPVKGLAAALRRELGDHGRYVRDYIVPVEFAISEAGGEIDYSRVNVHVMQCTMPGIFHDRGVFASMDDAGTPENRALFAKGALEVVLTLEEPREPNSQVYMPQ